jgi:hypothetical protein
MHPRAKRDTCKSDKQYWHKYLDFYEVFFSKKTFDFIAEIGVFNGDSIRFLLERFPEAEIHGGDIANRSESWPISDRFVFTQFDQGDREQLRAFLSRRQFSLIIEDGSHDPLHQAIALVEGLRALKPGGIYILEDVHTSHFGLDLPSKYGNALTVLLSLKHMREHFDKITYKDVYLVANGSIFSTEDVLFLTRCIDEIHLYRRTSLPDYCYKCNSNRYNYSNLRCICGVDLFSDRDSMAFVISKQ